MNKKDLIILAVVLAVGLVIGAVVTYEIMHREPVVYTPSPIVHQMDSINAILKASNVELDRKYKEADSLKTVSEVKYLNIKTNYEKLRKEVATYNSGSSNDLLNQLFPE